MKKLVSLLLSFIIIISLSASAGAANPIAAPEEWKSSWAEKSSDEGKIVITPGENAGSKNFSWISKSIECSFEYRAENNDSAIISCAPEQKRSFYGVVNTVKLKNLCPGKYSYSFSADSLSYGPYSFSVEIAESTFSVMFCTDSQIGRSGSNSEAAIMDDAYGWERTLSRAAENDISFIISAGDQVNDGFSKLQYNALLSPEIIKTLPIAAAAGNHDFYSPLFSYYFGNTGFDKFGNNSYFSYGNALFIMLDSNNIISAIHANTIQKAVSSYPKATWRVVVMHHSAYSIDSDDFSNKIAASAQLTKLFDSYDIDLVLSGHDHAYARTYPIIDGRTAENATVYLEGGSASGGKCNHFTSDSSLIAKSCDLHEASFSILTFSEDTLEIKSIKTDTQEVFDSFSLTAEAEKKIPVFGLIATIIDFFKRAFSFIPVIC